MTPAQYRVMERDAKEKHVLWEGEVFPMSAPSFAMAGASVAHNRLVGALLVALGRELRGRDCEALPSDMRIWVPSAEGYVYPDVSVAFAPLDLERIDGVETLRNPRVIFEVLSDASEAFDRGEKFDGYRSVASLSDYVLVSSTRREVDHFSRQPDGAWLLRAHREAAVLALAELGVRLSLDELYERAVPV
jgi:Uma2 family endonuclease